MYKAILDDRVSSYLANAKLGAGSKSFTAFLTASTSMSISFPVADVITVQLPLSSMYGRNSLAFSAEENRATLEKEQRAEHGMRKRNQELQSGKSPHHGLSRALASWTAAVLVATTPAESLMRQVSLTDSQTRHGKNSKSHL